MNPEQNPQSPAPFDPSQYDFITNPAQPPKKPLLPKVKGVRGGDKKPLLVMLLIGLVVITLLLLAYGLLFRGGGSSRDQLLSVARKQSTILAVSEIGKDKAGSTDTKSLANNVHISVLSDQNAAIEQISKNSSKPKAKDYSASAITEIEKKLEIAEQNGTFDVAFESTLKELLAEYQTTVKSAHDSVESKSAKELLAQTFENIDLLIKDAENNK